MKEFRAAERCSPACLKEPTGRMVSLGLQGLRLDLVLGADHRLG